MAAIPSRRFTLCLLAPLLMSGAVWAADPVQGRKKAAMACAVCHGPLGIAPMPSAPNLAGQQALYLSEQLKAYRSGKRKHEVMGVIAKPLTDQDIENLSAWYASIRIQVEPGS
jgi:cytochrome c553